jgi:DNA polymerase-4
LDLTGVSRIHGGARDRASAAGREVERAFGLHPTLGIASTRLVSRIAATVLAPDGELLDVTPGSEVAFLGPLAARLLPAARARAVAPRLDLLNVRLVRDVQALDPAQLRAAFGAAAGTALWREARGLDPARGRAAPRVEASAAEETLGQETNDGRALGARLSQLAVEVGVGLRARGTAARALAVTVWYADGRLGCARRVLRESTSAGPALRAAALDLLDRAAVRRVRVRRLRLEAWAAPGAAAQLTLWDAEGEGGGTPLAPSPSDGSRAAALEPALDRVRARFGTSALVPASWMAHGIVLRPPARP